MICVSRIDPTISKYIHASREKDSPKQEGSQQPKAPQVLVKLSTSIGEEDRSVVGLSVYWGGFLGSSFLPLRTRTHSSIDSRINSPRSSISRPDFSQNSLNMVGSIPKP